MFIGIVLSVILVHLLFALAIYTDATKRPAVYVWSIIWFVATLLFGLLAVLVYNSSKQSTA